MLVAAIFTWWGVIAYARRPRDPLQAEAGKRKWGCFRILLAIIACVVIAYAMFVLLVMGMGLLIGLGG
jgi:nitrate/nitrite transporter NarK